MLWSAAVTCIRATMRVWTIGPLLLCLISSTSVAGPAEVEELIRQGVALRRANEDQKSLPLFQKAYDLSATPRTAAQLGLVETALGYYLEAERHLNEALTTSKDAWVAKHRSTLDSTLRKVREAIGEVLIVG